MSKAKPIAAMTQMSHCTGVSLMPESMGEVMGGS